MKTFKTFLLPLFLLFTTLLTACGGGGGSSPTAATYSVVYSANGSTGGAVPSDTKAYAASSTATVLGNTGALVKTGYVFTGWNTAANGSGTAYLAGASLAISSANVTLYAAWAPTYSVRYDGNGYTGGTAPVDATAYVAGASAAVLGNTGTLVKAAGYVFTGWNTAVDGSGTAYAAGASLAIASADITLYAVWAPSHSVIYNGNGNLGGTAPVDATPYAAGASATVLGNTGTLTKAGDFFTGWNTAANGSGTAYAPGASIPMGSADVTLYAVWAPHFTVSYSGNGNTGGTAPVDAAAYRAGNSATVLGNTGALVKTGIAFSGWNTAADGSGAAYAAGDSLTLGSASVTLYSSWPQVTTLAGARGVSGSTDGIGAAASFDGPDGITTDGTNLFVADTANNNIRKIVIATGMVTTLAGTAGNSAYIAVDGTGAAARFGGPVGIAIDRTNLYVTDFNTAAIRKIEIATGVVTTLAGTSLRLGSADGIGAAARFNKPAGIATDGTNLFVADSGNHTVRKVVIATGEVTTLAGTAGSANVTDGTGTAAQFVQPFAMATDGTNLYVSDFSANTLRKVVIATGVVTTLAGTAGSTGSADGTGAAARFDYPRGLVADGANLYVADYNNCTIRQLVIATGMVTTLAGAPHRSGSTDGTTGAEARFSCPSGITSDGTNLYVSDVGNRTIRTVRKLQ